MARNTGFSQWQILIVSETRVPSIMNHKVVLVLLLFVILVEPSINGKGCFRVRKLTIRRDHDL